MYRAYTLEDIENENFLIDITLRLCYTIYRKER